MSATNNRTGADQLEDYIGFHRISYEKKKANNWRWLEENAEHLDSFHTDDYLDNNNHRIRLNYEYANGRGHNALLEKPEFRTLFMQDIDAPVSNDIKHYDILRRVLVRMWGEQQKTKLKGIVKDTSGYNINLRQKKTLELYQEFMNLLT